MKSYHCYSFELYGFICIHSQQRLLRTSIVCLPCLCYSPCQYFWLYCTADCHHKQRFVKLHSLNILMPVKFNFFAQKDKLSFPFFFVIYFCMSFKNFMIFYLWTQSFYREWKGQKRRDSKITVVGTELYNQIRTYKSFSIIETILFSFVATTQII